MQCPLFLWLSIVITSIPSLAQVHVPAYTAYLSPDVRGAQVSESQGIIDWNDPNLKVMWFGQLHQTGTLECSVELQVPTDQTVRYQLTVAGQFQDTTTIGIETPQTVQFDPIQVTKTGYHRFTLEAFPSPGKTCGDIKALILAGPASTGAHFNLKERRNAASVHLVYPVPPESKVAAFYCEMTALEDPIWTYYMACGWHRGYFGMQVNSPTERRIIFSVWDSGNEAIDRDKVADKDRVTLVAKGKDVYSGDFGNEGTGGHSHLKYQWRTGERQRFLVTAQPIDATHTVYSGFYFHPDQQEWILISSWRAPHEGGYMKGLYSFSENFVGANGHLQRKALYGNQWIQTEQGQWIELTTCTFSHDPTGKSDRLDRFMGIEDNRFFLSHGGFLDDYTEFGQLFTRPTTNKPPRISLPLIPLTNP